MGFRRSRNLGENIFGRTRSDDYSGGDGDGDGDGDDDDLVIILAMMIAMLIMIVLLLMMTTMIDSNFLERILP